MMITGERIEYVAVFGEPIAPIVLAHQLPGGLEFSHAPGQGHGQVANLPEFFDRQPLGLDESLIDADW